MSEWLEQFEKHRLHTILKELDSLLSELEALESLKANQIESVARMRQVERLVKSTLDSADPNLVSQDRLNGLADYVEVLTRDINQYKSSENVSYLMNQSSVDQILNQLGMILVPRVSEDLEGLREALTTLRRSIGQHARQLETESEEINREFKSIKRNFTELTEEIKSQKQRLDTAISQFQQQFSEAESKRRDEYSTEAANTRAELNKVVAAGKEEIDSLAGTLREEFDAAESNRKTEYEARFTQTKSSLETLLDKGKKDLSELTQQHKETFSGLVSETNESRNTMEADFAAKVSQYIAQLEERKSEAETLVQVIGNTGMVGGYQKVANQERWFSLAWQGLTLALLSGLITFAIIAFWTTIQADFRWGVFGARAFVAVAFGIAAAWASREAEKHQEVERRSRKMELELASINPYLALLPDDTQFEVKTELAKHFFGQMEPVPDKKSDKQVTGSALDLVRMALEIVAKKG